MRLALEIWLEELSSVVRKESYTSKLLEIILNLLISATQDLL
jgi:hypothetical protein